MILIVEHVWGSFEFEMLPDHPGYCRRTLTVKQLSGRPLEDDEWQKVMTEVVADAVARGTDVLAWGLMEADEEIP